MSPSLQLVGMVQIGCEMGVAELGQLEHRNHLELETDQNGLKERQGPWKVSRRLVK